MAEVKPNRTLVLCSRGATSVQKQVLKDFIRLLPHTKKEAKIDRKEHYLAINDLAEMHSCNNIVYLESRRRIAYLWISHFPNGPSIKFLVQNLHSSEEMRLSGNCLKGTRPFLSFDSSFKGPSHLKLIQQMLSQTFAVPDKHPKSMPFFDHVFSFSHCFDQIFFRNFEIKLTGKNEPSLVEIGPRFNLTIVKVLDGLLSGETLYKNGNFIHPKKEMRERERDDRGSKKRKLGDHVNDPDDVSIYDVYGD